MSGTVYLTGFMGTGKSAVGKELARLLKRPFVDLDARNRALVAKTGLLVGLSCSRAELVRRLRPARDSRPLLAGGSLSARVGKLLAARRAAYAGADWSVSTTSQTPLAAARRIARRLS